MEPAVRISIFEFAVFENAAIAIPILWDTKALALSPPFESPHLVFPTLGRFFAELLQKEARNPLENVEDAPLSGVRGV